MNQPEVLAKVEKVPDLPVAYVAGGAGVIGTRLCDVLLSQNLVVVCLDNLATGRRDRS